MLLYPANYILFCFWLASIALIVHLIEGETAAWKANSTNRQVVVELLTTKKKQGCALSGIFHDEEVSGTLTKN